MAGGQHRIQPDLDVSGAVNSIDQRQIFPFFAHNPYGRGTKPQRLRFWVLHEAKALKRLEYLRDMSLDQMAALPTCLEQGKEATTTSPTAGNPQNPAPVVHRNPYN